jgi:hypothetical protein
MIDTFSSKADKLLSQAAESGDSKLRKPHDIISGELWLRQGSSKLV